MNVVGCRENVSSIAECCHCHTLEFKYENHLNEMTITSIPALLYQRKILRHR